MARVSLNPVEDQMIARLASHGVRPKRGAEPLPPLRRVVFVRDGRVQEG